MMGAERKSMVMSEDDKRMTAYHEAGHTIVGLLCPDHDPVHKVSIIPRGRALGVTMFLPEEDRYSYTKQGLNSSICSLYGGRLAEEMIYGNEKVTTGAQNDIQRATDIATNMVTKWGLSDRMGPLAYREEDQNSMFPNQQNLSDETAKAIDEEIRRIIDDNYREAKRLLTEHIDKLHAMAEALVKYETIDRDQIDDIMNGRPPRPPEDWDDPQPGSSGGSDKSEEPESTVGEPANEH
jgi:cell division protease FtsH